VADERISCPAAGERRSPAGREAVVVDEACSLERCQRPSTLTLTEPL
jgi:hypothetical protein